MSVVSLTLGLEVSGTTVGNEGLFLVNINVVKEVVVHKVTVTLIVGYIKSDVLIEVYTCNGRKIDLTALIILDKSLIGTDGR